MFDDGEFVARDPAEAHRWFLRAAKQGHVQAELSLANQFLDGRGTPRDNRQAFTWYKQAADAGEPTAQYVTASFYERGGDGVAQNLNIARAYYAAAAAQGDETAGLKFKELSARLKAQGPASGAGAEPAGHTRRRREQGARRAALRGCVCHSLSKNGADAPFFFMRCVPRGQLFINRRCRPTLMIIPIAMPSVVSAVPP